MAQNDHESEIIRQLGWMHENERVRQERTIKRFFILCIMLVVLLVGTNIAWIVYESSFETISVSQEAESDSGNATINDGVHINGESQTDG